MPYLEQIKNEQDMPYLEQIKNEKDDEFIVSIKPTIKKEGSSKSKGFNNGPSMKLLRNMDSLTNLEKINT